MVIARDLLPGLHKDLFSTYGVKILYQDMFEMQSAKNSPSEYLIILSHMIDNIKITFHKKDSIFAIYQNGSIDYVIDDHYDYKTVTFSVSEEELFQQSTVEDIISYEELMLFKECVDKILADYEEYTCTSLLKKI